MDIHFSSFKKARAIWSFMEFFNINQYMNTNMREKMLKISNKHNLSEIASKTENRSDNIYVRTHISSSVSWCSLKTPVLAKNKQIEYVIKNKNLWVFTPLRFSFNAS